MKTQLQYVFSKRSVMYGKLSNACDIPKLKDFRAKIYRPSRDLINKPCHLHRAGTVQIQIDYPLWCNPTRTRLGKMLANGKCIL